MATDVQQCFRHWAGRRRAQRICYACLEALGRSPVLAADGRAFCARCSSIRLTERAALLDLWKRTREFVRIGLSLRLPPATLHELSPIELARKLGLVWTGGIERTLGHTDVGPSGSMIVIEAGLPVDLASEVLAHEAAHLWHARHGGATVGETLGEGFPQWVAYAFCKHAGLHHQTRRILRRPGPMGRGVRHLLALEQTSGRDAVIALAKKGEGVPATRPASQAPLEPPSMFAGIRGR